MPHQQTQQLRATAKLPTRLNSAGAKLVYLYLFIENEATIDELQAALGMKKVNLYPLLQTLTATNLVERTGTMYGCQEQPSDRGTR